MAPLGFFKNIKDFGKKVARKAGGVINKVGKAVKDIKDKLHGDKLLKYVPYGDIINDAIDVGTNIAQNAGEALENIGRGKNVIKEGRNAAKRILSDEKTNDYYERGREKVKQKTSEFTKKRSKGEYGIMDENVYRRAAPRVRDEGLKDRPSFLDNQLN